ncbi:dna ligase 1 [Lasallia pustulata]|uniref:Dna ligase 1 n=1 Tax=Lasallia pustulata TaxID=136370 RepID=A0A1W5D3L9_9LECA|nr:dna ligase 1 [Lasallia pustulata]
MKRGQTPESNSQATLSMVAILMSAAIGLVSEERGLSMRFPRFLKVRDDKSIEEASTSDFLAGLYRKQEQKMKETGVVGGDLPAVDGDLDEDD